MTEREKVRSFPLGIRTENSGTSQKSPTPGPARLNAQQIRRVVEGLCLPGANEVVIEIGRALNECFTGITTEAQLYKTLEKIVTCPAYFLSVPKQ